MVARHLDGPLFLTRLHQTAWRIGSQRQRRWIAAELFGIGTMILICASLGSGSPWHWHATAMLFGECLTAFFAVWIVHHDTPDSAGRTQRGAWINRLSYNMFFHMEHHLYPAVPTPHLHLLADRLDRSTKIEKRMVLPHPSPCHRRFIAQFNPTSDTIFNSTANGIWLKSGLAASAHPLLHLALDLIQSRLHRFWRKLRRSALLATHTISRYPAFMVIIRFPDEEAKRRALGCLPGRHSGKSWATGEMMVPEEALGFLAHQGVRFTVEGPATYEQIASLRVPVATEVQ
jgi:hypothetical protein